MRQLRLSVRRENNKGLKVGKFHDESSHKDTKKCAVKTQRRKNMFEYQTGYRIYENLLVCKASQQINNPDYFLKTKIHEIIRK